MLHTFYMFLILISTTLFTGVTTVILMPLLKKLAIMDLPSDRSNHAAPIPRGGGLAVMLSAISFLIVSGADGYVVWSMIILSTVSFLDDLYGLKARTRLIVQAIIVSLLVMDHEGFLFGGYLPIYIDKFLTILIWMWFINLYNFMDGIDGITVVQTCSLAVGMLVLFILLPHLPKQVPIDSLILAASMLGFVFWNWHPARLFLGDVGSIPTGFLMGGLLIELGFERYWAAALILPAYYLTDASFTLARRLLQGKRVWQAHSEHFYQQAVRAGRGHDEVSKSLAILNGGLILLAALSVTNFVSPLLCLLVAYAAVAAYIMRYLRARLVKVNAIQRA